MRLFSRTKSKNHSTLMATHQIYQSARRLQIKDCLVVGNSLTVADSSALIKPCYGTFDNIRVVLLSFVIIPS